MLIFCYEKQLEQKYNLIPPLKKRRMCPLSRRSNTFSHAKTSSKHFTSIIKLAQEKIIFVKSQYSATRSHLYITRLILIYIYKNVKK